MKLQTVQARYECVNGSCAKRTQEWEVEWEIVKPGLVLRPLVVCVECATEPKIIGTTRIEVER